ncbi:hypothetical protein KIH74_12040 [Kineosporia sp. J2-2]|uniref:Uncharacterized protein n=1 Tax=Kineosporia corallincola TaxID=2835133 RepID=A0ABS5TFN4_9ACTN|nr:hypothetical protein [Kineosporia corallincola]MBT0769658.1 hypothetical protein [Kineosporia corallincola]
MAEVASDFGSETAGPHDDPVTVTRPGQVTELSLRLSPDLHGQLLSMFAEYGIDSVEDGLLKSLGLWRYLDRALHRGHRLVVVDPRSPQGPFDVIDLRDW